MSENTPWRPSKYRVLLLASYCGDDNPECSDDFPCPDCLKMDNVFIIDREAIDKGDNLGGFEYNRRIEFAGDDTPFPCPMPDDGCADCGYRCAPPSHPFQEEG